MCPVLTAAAISHGTAPPKGITCAGSSCALWRPVVKNPSGNGGGGLRDHFDPDGYEDTGDGVCAKNPDARPWADPAAS
jgi:hypothetical protein